MSLGLSEVRSPAKAESPQGDAPPHLTLIPFTPVRVALGVFLLVAAGLKAHGLTLDPPSGHARLLLLILVEFEIGFGLWLLGGLYPRRTRQLALGFFVCLFAVSLYQVLTGVPSCACFGKLSISPWYTAILDLAVLAVLAQSSAETSASTPAISRRPLRFVAVGTAFLLVGLPAGFVMGRATAVRLTVLPPEIDLGTVSQGGYAACEFLLHNPHSVVVQVKPIESSCDCLGFQPSTLRLKPGQEARVVLTLDLQSEPNFAGRLAITAIGRAPDGRVAFRVVCHARVSPSALALVEIGAIQPFNEEVLR